MVLAIIMGLMATKNIFLPQILEVINDLSWRLSQILWTNNLLHTKADFPAKTEHLTQKLQNSNYEMAGGL